MTRRLRDEIEDAALRRDLERHGCPYPLGDPRVHDWLLGYVRGTFSQPRHIRIEPEPSWREIIYALAGAFAAGVLVWWVIQ